jgi:arylsulfatase A-like enzyme
MNIALVVVDSLRAASLAAATGGPRTPFLDGLAGHTVSFRRAHAAECWTLPAHLSMFTGLLPSEHGAHFQALEYRQSAPTIAEILAGSGYHTEVVTRNSLFDGSLPGVTRGFAHNTPILKDPRGMAAPIGMLLALAKPGIRRHLRRAGFFTALQRESREFLTRAARMTVPADREALAYATGRMTALRRQGKPFFFFLNLFDVHAPYPPSLNSLARPLGSPGALGEYLTVPFALAKLSGHSYLRPRFRLSERNRRMLLGRYHSAIELMDAKLAELYAEMRSSGLLEDTLLILTSDHGEAFGEHGLYFHDGSVWQTHLHVPLWIHHPDLPARSVDETVTTRDLFALMRAVGLGLGLGGTILERGAAERHPVALAEHFHYPHVKDILPRYAQNLATAIVGRHKVILRREGLLAVDIETDPDEADLLPTSAQDFAIRCRRDGIPATAIDAALAHVGRWEMRRAA